MNDSDCRLDVSFAGEAQGQRLSTHCGHPHPTPEESAFVSPAVSRFAVWRAADGEDLARLKGLRRHGYSKKKRPDLPQIVVGLAINRDGIPVRHWIYPGNQIDVSTVEEVTRDLLGLRPRRFLFVGDSGEKDPEFFAHVRAELGEDRVAGVLVRRVTSEVRDAARFAGMFVFDDPEEAALELTRLGVVSGA